MTKAPFFFNAKFGKIDSRLSDLESNITFLKYIAAVAFKFSTEKQ